MPVLRRPASFPCGKAEDSASSTRSDQSPNGCAGPSGAHLSQGRSERRLSRQRLGLSGLRLRQRGRALRLELLHRVRAGCLELFWGARVAASAASASTTQQAASKHPLQAQVPGAWMCRPSRSGPGFPRLPSGNHTLRGPWHRAVPRAAAHEIFNASRSSTPNRTSSAHRHWVYLRRQRAHMPAASRPTTCLCMR